MERTNDNTLIVKEHYAALNGRDLSRFTAIAADDCTVVDVPSGRVLHGREGYRRYAEDWLKSFPDLRIEPTAQVASDGLVIVEGRVHGTNTGSLASPTGELPPTNRSIDLAFCDVFELRDGRIVANRVYYDSTTFARQLRLGG